LNPWITKAADPKQPGTKTDVTAGLAESFRQCNVSRLELSAIQHHTDPWAGVLLPIPWRGIWHWLKTKVCWVGLLFLQQQFDRSQHLAKVVDTSFPQQFGETICQGGRDGSQSMQLVVLIVVPARIRSWRSVFSSFQR
jgi:hypothetical protein